MSGVVAADCCCDVIQACCLPDGSCIDLPPNECLFQGGTPLGPDTACADPDIDCELAQACCFEDGSCFDLPPAECKVFGGVPQGVGTTCIETECPGPPQICPNNCDLCSQTVTFIFSGIGARLSGEFNGEPVDCTVSHSGVVSVPITATCNWVWGGLDEIPNTCYPGFINSCSQLSSATVIPFVHGVVCLNEFWRIALRVRLRTVCPVGFAPCSVTYDYQLPNTDNCPFGQYAFLEANGGCSVKGVFLDFLPGSFAVQ